MKIKDNLFIYNQIKNSVKMLCSSRQWITLYFMLVEYCCGFNKEKIEHRCALTVFDKNRDRKVHEVWRFCCCCF